MKYQVIEKHKTEYPVTRLCAVLEVSRQGYYAWRRREPSQRSREDEALTRRIQAVHERSYGTYGSPRIQAELRDEGLCVSQHRIRRLMKAAGLEVRGPKRKRPTTTQSNPAHRKFANHLDRNFQAKVPNRKWVADITYVETAEGWLYVAGILDLCSRKLVGLAMDTHMESDLVQRALHMALTERQPEAGLLHHSDQGSQYTSGEYFMLLDGHQITISMSRRGECLDNAPMESFWGTLKTECADHRFESIAQAKAEIFAYCMGWYNLRRRHSSLDYLSPHQFERLHGWTA